MPEFILSTSEVTLLGISEAGWFALMNDARNRYGTTYGWSADPLRQDVVSVYQLYLHSKKINSILSIKLQAEANSANIRSIMQEFPGELNENLWHLYCAIKNEKCQDVAVNAYFQTPGNDLITFCESIGRNFDDFLTEMLIFGANNGDEVLDLLLTEQQNNVLALFNEFKDHLIQGLEQAKGDFPKTDHNLDYSKRLIVNTLQENIIRYYEGKELIPIEMIVMKHDEKEGGFYPDFSFVMNKTPKNYSSSELRMIYKVMEEIPDKGIRKIMRLSFFLKEMTVQDGQNTFKTLENPWDSHASVGGGSFWQTRTRKHGEAYRERLKPSLPLWVKGLIQTKEMAEEPNNQSKNGFILS